MNGFVLFQRLLWIALFTRGAAFRPGFRRRNGTRLAASESRRRLLFSLAGATLLAPRSASASDNRLFESTNSGLLTNRVLEQFRIWEQEEANMVQYGGELARGDAGNQGKVSAYPSLLVPILQLEEQVQAMQTALEKRENYATVLALLQQPQYETVVLKRTFNDFADNIYYSDPDRANLYLGGGGTCVRVMLYSISAFHSIVVLTKFSSFRVTATPKSIQSLAYLLRNEVLDNLNALRAELQYQLQNKNASADDNDVAMYVAATYTALQRYRDIVPASELQGARDLLLRRD